MHFTNYAIETDGLLKKSSFTNLKSATKEEEKLHYMKILKKHPGKVAHFCNSEEAHSILERALRENILDDNDLVITHNYPAPNSARNSCKLDNTNFKDLNVICCWSIGENNASSIDYLYKKTNDSGNKIIIHDEILFLEKSMKRTHKYRKLTYSLDEESHIPSHFANDGYIEELKSIINGFQKKITHLDICAGQGCIGFSLFKESNKIEKLFLVEINPTQVTQMHKTIQLNKLPEHQIEVILSNVLESFSSGVKVDLVSGNPPHTDRPPYNRVDLQGADENWNFHKTFLSSISKYLSDDGIVTLLENSNTSDPDTFKSMLGNDLEIFNVKYINLTPWYIIFIKKKGQNTLYQ